MNLYSIILAVFLSSFLVLFAVDAESLQPLHQLGEEGVV